MADIPPDMDEKQISSGIVQRMCHKCKVIGAIDAFHIRIQRPPAHAHDYLNRKGHFPSCYKGYMMIEEGLLDINCTPHPLSNSRCSASATSPFYVHGQEMMYTDYWDIVHTYLMNFLLS